MKKKLLSLALVLCMTVAMAVPAMATNPNTAQNVNGSGDDVNAPHVGPYDGTGTIQNNTGDIESYGFATQDYDGQNDQWITDSDDDGTDGDPDTDGTDIYVWARITGEGAGMYKIDIAWGAMKFVFNGGDGKMWDVDKHEYVDDPLAGGSKSKEWVVAGYLDGTNNKIDVTNHSNRGVTAEFSYVMEENTGNTMFNDAWQTKADAVVGGFYASEQDAVDAAAEIAAVIDTSSGDVNNATIIGKWLKNNIWDNGANSYTENVYNAIELPTADHYNHGGIDENSEKTGNLLSTNFSESQNDETNGKRTESVYFAFSGTPDDGKSASLANFTKVGVITVTVSPNESPALNHKATTAP